MYRLFILLSVLAVPLIVIPGFDRGFELPKLIAYLVAIDVLVGFFVLRHRRKPITLDIWDWLAVGWIAIIIGSSIAAGDLVTSFFGSYWWHQGILLYIHLAAMFVVMRRIFSNPTTTKLLVQCLITAGLIQSSVIILQWLQIQLGLNISTYSLRPVGTFGQPNAAAGFVVVGFAAAVGLYGLTKNRSYLAAAVIAIIGIVLTASLGVILSACVVVFTTLLIALKSAKPRSITALGFLVILGLFVKLGIDKEQITFDNFGSARVESRLSIWPAAIKLFSARPLVGYGSENIGRVFPSQYGGEYVDRAHNDMLDTLLTGGIFLGTVYVAFVVGALLKSLSAAKHFPIALMIIATIARGLTEPSLVVNLVIFWLVLALALPKKE